MYPLFLVGEIRNNKTGGSLATSGAVPAEAREQGIRKALANCVSSGLIILWLELSMDRQSASTNRDLDIEKTPLVGG